jgi:hypothetical protein
MSLCANHLDAVENDDATHWVEAAAPYGSASNHGTPGQTNTVTCSP